MYKKIYTLFFLFVSVVAVAQKQTPVSLKEGQVINVTTSMDQTTEMGPGMEMKMNTKSTSKMNVQKVTANGILVSNQITRIVTDIDGMGQTMTFDSDKKEDMDSEEGASMKSMLDVVNYFTIDKTTGKFSSVDKNGQPKAEGAEETNGGMLQMGGGTANNANQMKSIIAILPANAKPGYSWTDTSSAGGIKTITTNTVNKIENGIAYLDMKGTTIGSTKMSMQGQDLDVTVDGTFTGKGEVNSKTNLTKMQAITSDVKSTIDMMGQTMDMTTKGTTTMTFE